jgi:lipocalin
LLVLASRKNTIECQLSTNVKRGDPPNFVGNKIAHNLCFAFAVTFAMTFFFFLVTFLLASPTEAFFFDFFGGFLGGRNDCRKIDPPTDFDVDKYIEKTWYIQSQQENSYQPEEDLFCITATYGKEGKRQFFRSAITVRNYGNTGLNVENGSSGGFVLCATQPSPDADPARLRVAPCFLPPALFAGDYWVVAFDPDYRWAIVTGGQPTIEGCGDDLCRNKIGNSLTGNGEGVWFFTREQLPDSAVAAEMDAKAASLGICTAKMKTVVQEGCTYVGATIKS